MAVDIRLRVFGRRRNRVSEKGMHNHVERSYLPGMRYVLMSTVAINTSLRVRDTLPGTKVSRVLRTSAASLESVRVTYRRKRSGTGMEGMVTKNDGIAKRRIKALRTAID